MSTPPHATRRILVRLVFGAVVCALLYAGLRPHAVPELFHEEDKIYHLLGFATLAMCTRVAFPRHAWWWQALAMLALGAGIELAQNLQPARFGSVWDFLFDTLGVGVGLALTRLPFMRRLTHPS